MDKQNGIKAQIWLFGNEGSGKTSILTKAVSDKFNPQHLHTIGVDFMCKNMTLKNQTTVRLQLWDTAGSERFRTMTFSFLRRQNVQTALLIFDVESTHSKSDKLKDLQYWINLVQSTAGRVRVYLVVNKIDKEEFETGTASRLWIEAHQRGFEYREVSAMTGEGVNQLFFGIAFILEGESLFQKQRHKNEEIRTLKKSQTQEQC